MADDFVVRRDLNGVPIHGYDQNTDLVKSEMYGWDYESLESVKIAATGGGLSPGDILAPYKISDFDDSGDPSYFGFVAADGSWYIMRFSASSLAIRYCRGASGYTTAWGSRTSQTYGYFSEIF